MLSDFKAVDAQTVSNMLKLTQTYANGITLFCAGVEWSPRDMPTNDDGLNGASKTFNFVTSKQLMSYLKISRATITRHLTRGIPHERLGARIYFRIDDVVIWLREQGQARQAKRRTR
jgi:hypothetical protein